MGLNNFFGAKKIINAKSAKVQIEILIKDAKLKLKEDYIQEALKIYSSAKQLANEWELNEDIAELDNLIRLTQIGGLKTLKNIYENNAKKAEKDYFPSEALKCYDMAYKAATEIFKLGLTKIEKDIKRIKKKIEELKNALE